MKRHQPTQLLLILLFAAFLLKAFPASAQVSFSREDYPAGRYPQQITAADFNGDGRPDLALANSYWEEEAVKGVAILLNDGNGGYGAPAIYATGESADDLHTGDLNGDGHPDVVVVSRLDDRLTVLLNDGLGAFPVTVDYDIDQSPYAVRVADFNNDGHPDVVTTSGDNVAVMINTGDGALAAGVIYTTTSAIRLAVGDVNNDGYDDIAVTNGSSNIVSILVSNGDGTFAPQVTYPTGAYANYATIEDLNGDGWSDLVVTNRNDNTLSILLNNGNGTFAAHVVYNLGNSPATPVAGDLDGDGHADLAIVNGGDGNISILLNNSDGTFSFETTLGIESGFNAAVIADLNGDGRNDIAVTNTGFNDVSVLLNESPCPPGENAGPPVAETTVSKSLASGMNYFYDGCTLLATIVPAEETAGGEATVRVSFAGDLPAYHNARYLRQYYDISVDTPVDDATVTLFFSQAEFDYYNTTFGNENEAKLPDNLRIARYSGEYSLTGASLSAEEKPAYIVPSAVIWNSALALWEVSFDTPGFSGFFITGQSDEALPVTLADFTAAVQEQSALLTWKTSAEVNFSHFEVQRSADSRQWLTLGSIAAADKSDALTTYRYRDSSPLPSYNYYRLKMADRDGTYTYSKIRSVMIGSNGNSGLQIYPNPVSDRIYLTTSGTISDVLFRDISGRPLQQVYSYEKEKGISMSGLSPGVILVEVRYADGTIRVGRIVVAR